MVVRVLLRLLRGCGDAAERLAALTALSRLLGANGFLAFASLAVSVWVCCAGARNKGGRGMHCTIGRASRAPQQAAPHNWQCPCVSGGDVLLHAPSCAKRGGPLCDRAAHSGAQQESTTGL